MRGYLGCQIKDCADAMQVVITKAGYTMNILDPDFTANIDYNPLRFNVKINSASIITGFTIG